MNPREAELERCLLKIRRHYLADQDIDNDIAEAGLLLGFEPGECE